MDKPRDSACAAAYAGFRFNRKGVAQGCATGGAIFLLLAALGGMLGYVKPDVGWVATVICTGAGGPLFLWWRLNRQWKGQTQNLGGIEADASGIRWRQGDKVPFQARWSEVLSVVIDTRHRQMQLTLANRPPFLIQDVGLARLDGFDALRSTIENHVPYENFNPRSLWPVGKRTLVMGLLTLLEGSVLYVLNLSLRGLLGWHRGVTGFPLLVGSMGLLYIFVGALLMSGRGALATLHQHRGAPRQLLRFCVFMVFANFVLLTLLNWALRNIA